jgi:hypothetical protein
MSLSLVEDSAYAPPRLMSDSDTDSSRLDELSARLADLNRDGNVEQALALGRVVLEVLYGGDLASWRQRGAKAHSLRTLARRTELTVSSSVLYRSVALYELERNLGGLERWSGLGISHLRLVLGLPVSEQRRLLDAASTGAWTVAELEREATAVRRRDSDHGGRGGRPRLPRFVKSVNRLCRAVAAPDELFGDLDAVTDMSDEQVADVRDMLATIRMRCDELERSIELRREG